MRTENQYFAALDQVQTYADDFNMTVLDVVTQEVKEDGGEDDADQQETREQHYIVLEDNNRTVYVTCQQQWEFFALQYPLDFVDFVAGGLSEEDVGEILDKSDDDKDNSEVSDQVLAAREVIKNTDTDIVNTLKSFLNTAAPEGQVEFQTQRSDEIPLTGMSMVGYIFPYEDDFSLRTFSDKIMEVLVAGQRASNIVSTSTRLTHPDEGESEEYEMKSTPSFV